LIVDKKTVARVEVMKLLGSLQQGDEKPGWTILRALQSQANVKDFVDRLAVVFTPRLSWDGAAIRKIIQTEYDAMFAPGHTDMMVTPESLDAFLAENQLPE
jgi:hypothetical protein